MLIVCGLPVYMLRTTFGHGYEMYQFKGVINQGLIDHVMHPDHEMIQYPEGVNDNNE